jgi:hypothetical protein
VIAVGAVVAALFDGASCFRIAGLRVATQGFRQSEKSSAEKRCVLKKSSAIAAHFLPPKIVLAHCFA